MNILIPIQIEGEKSSNIINRSPKWIFTILFKDLWPKDHNFQDKLPIKDMNKNKFLKILSESF